MAAEMSRSSSTKCKKKHFKPKHQKSKLFRANEPLLSVFMWGINHTVNELNHVNIPVMLMPDDFRAFTKIKVDNHLYQKDIMPSHFKIKEYCPLVFRNLRERFSFSDNDYLKSLTKTQPELITSSFTKTYITYDNKLILKTLSTDEVENMHNMLKEYHPYIVERSGKTLLPQYLGMYRLSFEGQVTYIVVMRNIVKSRLPIHQKYEGIPSHENAKLQLDSENKNAILSLLEADTLYLAKENVIDYSLNLYIHDCSTYQQEVINSPSSSDDDDVARMEDEPVDAVGVITSSQKFIYYIGFADVLTQFGLRKRTIDPEQYRKKFLDSFSKTIEVPA